MSLRLGQKALLVAAAAVTAVAALAGASIYHLYALREAALGLARDIHQASLSADFDAAVTRAAGEAAVALASGGNPNFAEEARQALTRARTALDGLEATMFGYDEQPEYAELHRSVLQRQHQVLREVKAAIARADALHGSSDSAQIKEVLADLFAYERVSDPMRGEISELLRHEAQENEQAIQRSLDHAMYSAAATVILLALVAAGVLVLMRRRVVAPLTDLAGAAAAVARGALDRTLPVTSNDEIGDLQRAFNWMVRDLAHQHAALEQRNQELARAIADAERERSTAEEASRAKSQFLANVSHEIRTPLHGVLGLTELLLASKLSSEQRHFVTTIDQSGRELLQIINDILDLSRIEARRMELHIAPFALRAMVADVARLFAAAALRKGLSLQWEAAPDIPQHVAGDPVRIRQVLTNLVDNSIKFTDAGSVRIVVEPVPASGRDADELVLRFTVRDTGAGVPAAVHDRVFDAFVQGDSSSTRRHGGTGLGLAIARKLTLLMNGRIGFDNLPGGGAAFWFTVQVRRVGAGEAEAIAAAETVPAAGQPLERAGSILLVEDNDTNRAVALAMLRSLGCQADVARDGNEAVQALARNSYDLILMDCQMPEMDGLETTRLIREQEALLAGRVSFATHGMPIIAVTANAAPSNRERCLEAGMNEFLAKPFTRDALAMVLARWLPESPQRADGGPAPGDTPLALETIEKLRALQGQDDTQFLQRVVADYCRNAGQHLDALRAAAARGDAAALEHAAHKLKSSSACLGALRLAGHCGEIEDMARAGDLAESELALDALAAEVNSVQVALQAAFPLAAHSPADSAQG